MQLYLYKSMILEGSFKSMIKSLNLDHWYMCGGVVIQSQVLTFCQYGFEGRGKILWSKSTFYGWGRSVFLKIGPTFSKSWRHFWSSRWTFSRLTKLLSRWGFLWLGSFLKIKIVYFLKVKGLSIEIFNFYQSTLNFFRRALFTFSDQVTFSQNQDWVHLRRALFKIRYNFIKNKNTPHLPHPHPLFTL